MAAKSKYFARNHELRLSAIGIVDMRYPPTIDSCRTIGSIMKASLAAKALLSSSLSSYISVNQGGIVATELWVAAIIAQFVRGACRWRAERIVDAGDGAQILIDGFDLMVGHVVKKRPGHDLELATVHRRRDADAQRYIGVRVRLTSWVNLIEIGAVPQNFPELCKRASAFRTSILIRRQVAGNDDRTGIRKSGCGINR